MSLKPEILFVIAALSVLTLVLSAVIAVQFRRQARTLEEKRRSDSRYRTVVEQAGDGIFLVDAETGRLTEAQLLLAAQAGLHRR
jgi:PAS domain-containing protein